MNDFLTYRKNFVGTQKQFELALVNESSVFELLRFDCSLFSRALWVWKAAVLVTGYA